MMIGQDDPYRGGAPDGDGAEPAEPGAGWARRSTPPGQAGGWRPDVSVPPARAASPAASEEAQEIVRGADPRDPARLWSIAGSWPDAGPTFALPPDPTPPGVPTGPPAAAGPIAAASTASTAVGVPMPAGTPMPTGTPAPGPGAEAEAEDPWRAATRYRDLLGTSDVTRARAGRDAHHRRQGSRAQAQRHRAAARDIRARVDGVWGQVAEPLAQYGLTDLDQLRPADPGAAAVEPAGQVRLTKGGASTPGGGSGGRRRAGRPLARAGHGPAVGVQRTRGGQVGPTPTDRTDRRRRGSARAGGAAAGPAGPVDPRTAPRQAYELCLDAMSKAAELRAVSKGAASASAGLMTALASLLSLAVVGLLRVFAHAPGMPCVVGAALVASGLVAAAAGMEVGVKAIARAGMLGAGCAAVAVLATFRLAPTDPVAIAGSLVALAAAARFGLGVGAPTQPQAQAGSRAGASRKG
ncbi:hypothetical protein MXD59_09395 [Frankia sp. Ag45/Mut15]|uniref:Uncharacterized protein n=1 Tax=Frankia umida TaxID=573489 RepID=A0ABT0JWR4_9ACTN|nr:hypothetical protein [Frankia umida]MCK9875987.1 hypothetical protein [Frankia umida]